MKWINGKPVFSDYELHQLNRGKHRAPSIGALKAGAMLAIAAVREAYNLPISEQREWFSKLEYVAKMNRRKAYTRSTTCPVNTEPELFMVV
jgi:hypothetical protein